MSGCGTAFYFRHRDYGRLNVGAAEHPYVLLNCSQSQPASGVNGTLMSAQPLPLTPDAGCDR